MSGDDDRRAARLRDVNEMTPDPVRHRWNDQKRPEQGVELTFREGAGPRRRWARRAEATAVVEAERMPAILDAVGHH